ncbi:MAG: peptide-methionine (R)-S-oxide reductase MsrB [Planctomycetota bacterium]
MKPITALLCLCAVALSAVGCANETAPYNEQTAQIDPAMNQPEPKAPSDSPTEPTSDRPFDGLDAAPDEKVELTDEQWKSILSEEEFYVLRRAGTERAFTGRYHDHDLDVKGAFHCAGCGQYLYDVQHKFHSGCGWPSFYQAVAPGAITEHRDESFGMVRTEMRCSRCGSHLGHIFNDGIGTPTGMRHCVNGTALIFVPEGEDPVEVIRAHREKYANK